MGIFRLLYLFIYGDKSAILRGKNMISQTRKKKHNSFLHFLIIFPLFFFWVLQNYYYGMKMVFEGIIEVARPPSIFDVIILLFRARLPIC